MMQPKILQTVRSEADGLEVYIFERHEADDGKPFGVRFWDFEAGETIGVYFCATLDAAQEKMAHLSSRF